MIGKISKGKGFKEVLAYAAGETAKDQHASLLCQNIVDDPTTKALAKAFDQHTKLGNTKHPVLHMVLAPTHKDWEKLKDDPILSKAIIDTYMDKMGLDSNHPRAAFIHDEKDGSGHFHIITTNVHNNGKIWNAHREIVRSMKACRELETEFKLEVVSSKPAQKRRPPKNEIEKYKRTGDVSPFEHIQQSIDDLLQNGLISQSLFKEQLKKAGIEYLRKEVDGELKATQFIYKGIIFKGSNFGKAYGAAGLTSRGLCSDESYATYKDDFKRAGQPVFESVESQILKAPTPKPIEKEPDPLPKTKRPDPRLKTVLLELNQEFDGTAKDKKHTFNDQADQAIFKASTKYPDQLLQGAIVAYNKINPNQGLHLTHAYKRHMSKTSKANAITPYFSASTAPPPLTSPPSQGITINASDIAARRALNDSPPTSYNPDDGSLFKAWDLMTEHEKNEHKRRQNTPRPGAGR